MPRTKAVVYWLYDSTCVTPLQHGYVGTTVDWPHRLYRHRSESTFPAQSYEGKILFQGTIKQCLALERMLRPTARIGWNELPGGLFGRAQKGIPKSPEQREKMRQAALRRYADPDEHERTSKAVKVGIRAKNRDLSGSKNPNFGKHHSAETKQKIRDKIVERGGISGENNPNYRHGRYAAASSSARR